MVYDILPSTTAVFSYAIGSRKLSANEQCFIGAQTVVSLLQTTQIKQGVSFIAINKVYTSTNKTTIVWIETELFSLPGVDASHVYVGALAGGCFYSHISTGTFRRALTASVDSCAEIKSAWTHVNWTPKPNTLRTLNTAETNLLRPLITLTKWPHHPQLMIRVKGLASVYRQCEW